MGSSTWNGRIQIVYLDFSNNDTMPGNTADQHVYTADEKLAIKALIEKAYKPFNDAFGVSDTNKPFIFTLSKPVSGDYVTLSFNKNTSFGTPGGEASEVDLGNSSLGGSAAIQVNGILGNPNQPPEFYAAGTTTSVTATSAALTGFVGPSGQTYSAAQVQNNWVVLSAKIAAHEL